MEFKEYFATRRAAVESYLADYMERSEVGNDTLREAMKHTLFSGGKRFRPTLAIAAAEVFGKDMDAVMPAACALELIHTYSLIHDDLPSMDDDDFRRGKPTSHKVFGEAMAILAGDALLTAAFDLIARNREVPGVTDRQVLEVISDVARACGAPGMVGGQAIDIESTGVELDSEQIETLDRLKTGALIGVSARIGAVLAGASKTDVDSMTTYGQCLGMAFQISDDVLDTVGDESKMGKRLRKDEESEKNSLVGALGLDGARERAAQYIGEAKRALEPFGDKALILANLADLVVNRES
jgi:geranylgeranyl diphosphate synthase type II